MFLASISSSAAFLPILFGGISTVSGGVLAWRMFQRSLKNDAIAEKTTEAALEQTALGQALEGLKILTGYLQEEIKDSRTLIASLRALDVERVKVIEALELRLEVFGEKYNACQDEIGRLQKLVNGDAKH